MHLAALRLRAAGWCAVHEHAELTPRLIVIGAAHAIILTPVGCGFFGRRRQGPPEDDEEHRQGVLKQVRERPNLQTDWKRVKHLLETGYIALS